MMDPKISVVLDISSDEEADSNWLTGLLRHDGDEEEECVVLDKDPNAEVNNTTNNTNTNTNNNTDDSDDILVVSEKGQVACRDYPHSRHLCVKFPFSTTPNQNHCSQCYCYVCDSLAPCVYWGNGSSSIDHCHATDKDQFWILERKNAKNSTKTIQPISQPPPVNLYIPAPVKSQPPNQIPNPSPINHHRNQLHPDLLSRFVIQAQQKYNQNSTVHRPVFKRTHPLRATIVGHQNRYSSYRGNLGNPIRQNSYQVNGMLSGSSNYVGSLQQPNTVNASVPYPPQSQTFTPLTVNQPQPQPQPQPQFSSQLNPSFQSHVNSNLHYQPAVFPPPPSSSQPQPASSQLTHTVPVEPIYQVDSPLVLSDVTQNANQCQGSIVDLGLKDYGLGLPTGQDSGGGVVSGGLADYRFDWMFDNQSIEPGFTDYSSDSAFIDTGPIFQF